MIEPLHRSRVISKDEAFADCVILDKDAFDPDAVFLEDIVDDDVLPRLSLAVEGLTPERSTHSNFQMPSEDTIRRKAIQPSDVMPDAKLGADQLEVYGWESSLWRKIRGYLGF